MAKVNKNILNNDHSFKKWFKIMCSNGYILLFVIFGVISVISSFFPGVFEFDPDGNWNWFTLGFGLLGMFIIAYKGFYKFWKELKNNNMYNAGNEK